MLDTMEGACGYTEIQCIWSKSGYNEIQSWLNSMNRALDTIRYNVSGPSLDTMDTNLTSRIRVPRLVSSESFLRLWAQDGAVPYEEINRFAESHGAVSSDDVLSAIMVLQPVAWRIAS